MRGEQWHLTPKEEALSAERVKDYQEVDPWEEIIRGFIVPSGRVTTKEILALAIKIDFANQTRQHEMRASRILKADGWARRKRWNDEKKRQEWVYEKDCLLTD